MNWFNLFLAIVSLSAIGVGVWWVYPPAALITVGALLWIDLWVTPKEKDEMP